MFVKYILIYDSEGYATETKFLSEIEHLELPKKNDNLINFYEENVKFFNLSSVRDNETGYLIKNDTLNGYDKQQVREELATLLEEFIVELNLSKSSNLFSAQKDEKTIFEELCINAKKHFGVNFLKPEDRNFNLNKYKDIQNYMIAFAHISDEPYVSSYIKNFINVGNNALIHDNIIIPGDGFLFRHKTIIDDNGNEVKIIPYNIKDTMGKLNHNYSSIIDKKSINKKPFKI